MAFISLLFYIACIYIRPQEWVQAFYGIPLVNITAIVTIILFFFSQERKFVSAPQNYIMLWFLLALVASHLSHFYLGGALNAFQDFIKTIIMYFLIVNIVTTEKRFRITIDVMILLTLVLAIQGITQHHSGVGLAGQPILIEHGVPRITWIGIFNDPNDLALGFVVAIPFLLDRLASKHGIMRKIFPITALGILLYAIYLTNSRGGMLALGAVICSYAYCFFKRNSHFVSGVILSVALVGAVLAFGPSRMGDLSSEDESAHGRIDAWYEGFDMLKSAPLFGVGYNMFTDFNHLTAHNSFVLCAAETGFFGYCLWISLFYFSFTNLTILTRAKAIDRNLSSSAFSLEIGIIGFLAAAYFLSRTYNPLPYILIALSVALIDIAKKEKIIFKNNYDGTNFRNILVISFVSLVFTYGLMRFTI